MRIMLVPSSDLFKQFLLASLTRAGVDVDVVHRDLNNMWRKIMILSRCDVIHIISIKPSSIEGLFWILCLLFLRVIGKRIVLHWIGTDVLELSHINGRILSKLINKHCTQAPWLVEELREKGIEAEWVPFLSPLNIGCEPLPKRLTVLVYFGGISGRRHEFYGSREVVLLAQTLPGVNFHIVGDLNEDTIPKLPNVHFYGRVPHEEMYKMYDRCTVLLRLTKHDGLSLMVLEALSRGRYVIWTERFPHCCAANNVYEAMDCLEKIQGMRTINTKGIEYVDKAFINKMWINRLIQVYEEIKLEEDER